MKSETAQRVHDRDHVCRRCGSASDLHIHHIQHRSGGGEDDERNLVLLCGRCHRWAHSQPRPAQRLLEAMLDYQYEQGLWLTVDQVERRMKSRLN